MANTRANKGEKFTGTNAKMFINVRTLLLFMYNKSTWRNFEITVKLVGRVI